VTLGKIDLSRFLGEGLNKGFGFSFGFKQKIGTLHLVMV